MPDLVLPPACGELLGDSVGESHEVDAVLVQEPDVAQFGRDFSGVVELYRCTVVHGCTRIEEDIDGKVRLFLEEPQNERVGAQVRTPIDVLGVFTRYVLLVVRKLDP